MKFFVVFIFWLFWVEVVLKLINISTGANAKPITLNQKAADTILIAILCIWGGFVLWV